MRFFTCVNYLYQFFSCVRNWYQFFSCMRNWYQFYTYKMNWLQFFTHERVIGTNFSHMKEELVPIIHTRISRMGCVAKHKSNMANLSNLYPRWRVILEKLINHKTKIPFLQLSSPWVGGVCEQNICYHVAAFMIPFNLICNMPLFWKKWILIFWIHTLGSWSAGGGGGCGFCMQNICYHVGAFMFPFNLICNLTMFWKSWILTYWPFQGVGGKGLRAEYLLPCCWFRDSI